MEGTRFQLGDRVRSRTTTEYIKAGMVGTVQRVFLSVDDTYDIVFDGKHRPVVMRGHELERVEHERDVGS
jgi:hypothetical protein